MNVKVNKPIDPAPAGNVWCPEHRRWEPENDPIDFLVSDNWRDHYYECGLTPYPSPTYQRPGDRMLIEALRECMGSVAELSANVLSEERPKYIEPQLKAPPIKSSGGAINL